MDLYVIHAIMHYGNASLSFNEYLELGRNAVSKLGLTDLDSKKPNNFLRFVHWCIKQSIINANNSVKDEK